MKRIVLLLLAFVCFTTVHAQKAYAVYKDGTITYYYDDLKESREGEVFEEKLIKEENSKEVVKAVFDPSIANWTNPSVSVSVENSLHGFFTYYINLKEITGLEYLNTSNVIDMSYMFYSCSGLISLDVSNLSTSKVTRMDGMFESCSNLKSLDLSNLL